jgi:FlaA1/EpsC-like NDP-sugar epimerase
MLEKINILPRWIIFLMDLFICSISLVLAVLIRHNLSVNEIDLASLSDNLLMLAIVNALVFLNLKTYAGIIRYSGVQDSFRIFCATCISAVILFFVNIILVKANSGYSFSNVVLIINALISFIFLTSYRFTVKFFFTYFRTIKMDRKTVIIYGAGEAGFTTKRVLQHDPKSVINIAAFIDDDPKKIGKVADGIRIRNSSELKRIISQRKIDEIIIAAFTLSTTKKNELVEFCLENDIKVLSIPPFQTWINGEFSTRQLRNIRIEDLLEREPIKINNLLIGSQITNKRILVTGAAGSIGSEIVRQLLKYEPHTIILLDQAETPLHTLELEIEGMNKNTVCISYLGDVSNRQRMASLFETYKPHYVYHAAAYKHVPMMEICPSEAILTNVMGTKIIADLAVTHKVQRFVMISTDKAVNPTNVMGASKRLAEMYVQSMSNRTNEGADTDDRGNSRDCPMQVKFITTRFGNVLGSNGSVINRFKQQIEDGLPITVTHPGITRYFMTIPEACQLVLEAGSMGKGGEIFVFDMGKSVKIVELAKKMIRLYGLVPGVDVEIKYTGLRRGEKLYEELLTGSEDTIHTYHEKIMIAKVRSVEFDSIDSGIHELIALARKQDSTLDMVAKMKQLVPEFISNNSEFEQLDNKKPELSNQKVVLNVPFSKFTT